SELVLRLRAIQGETAAAPPERRRELLQKQLASSLASVPAGQRQQYLEAALARFPVAGQIAASRNASADLDEAPTTLVPPAPAPGPRSPEDLLNAFLSASAELPEEQRNVLARKLAEAGFAWVDRDALVLEVGEEFRKSFGLRPEEQPRLSRMMQLTLLLIDLM